MGTKCQPTAQPGEKDISRAPSARVAVGSIGPDAGNHSNDEHPRGLRHRHQPRASIDLWMSLDDLALEEVHPTDHVLKKDPLLCHHPNATEIEERADDEKCSQYLRKPRKVSVRALEKFVRFAIHRSLRLAARNKTARPLAHRTRRRGEGAPSARNRTSRGVACLPRCRRGGSRIESGFRARQPTRDSARRARLRHPDAASRDGRSW